MLRSLIAGRNRSAGSHPCRMRRRLGLLPSSIHTTQVDQRLPVCRQSRISPGRGAALLWSKRTHTCHHDRGGGQASALGGFMPTSASVEHVFDHDFVS